jgi:argininosuccinate lyase
MNKKLWQKNNSKLNEFIETFETEGDLLMDQKLIPFDLEGSLAHAKMLLKKKLLNQKEFSQIEKGLKEISKLYGEGKFKLASGDEDMHTKIENYLTGKYGEAGKKIHTLRSRNDQILTALRLYSKHQLNQLKVLASDLNKSFEEFSNKYGNLPVPGYTHMQKAMPSNLKLWVGAFISSLKDDIFLTETALKLNDKSPLGSAAGYGLPVSADREYTAKLLNFSGVLEPVTYTQNSRGKIEALTIAVMVSILQTINKFASDVLLFSTQEFAFFKARDSITTGSSIMPQKKNIDLAELLRSKTGVVLGNYVAVVSVSSNLISGYNRDLQETKKNLIESFEITKSCLKAAQILIENIKPQKETLKKSMTEDLYQTEKALELVLNGVPFREAYLQISKEYEKGGVN